MRIYEYSFFVHKKAEDFSTGELIELILSIFGYSTIDCKQFPMVGCIKLKKNR